MNTEQRIIAVRAILAALLSEATPRSNPNTVSQEDHDTIWAGIPEKYRYLARRRGSRLFLLFENEPRPDGTGGWIGFGVSYYELASESGLRDRFDVLERVQRARLPLEVNVVADTACLLKRNETKPESATPAKPLAVGSGSTFTRLTGAQKTAIWADVGPNWVCVVFCPKSGLWQFYSEIPKREGDKWVSGPRAEYVSLSLMNSGAGDAVANARVNTLAGLAASQPNFPWIILRSGDPRTAAVEAAASKLPAPAPAASTNTPEPVFRADAPEPPKTPHAFWKNVAYKHALFATRSNNGLVSLWRYAPHRVFGGWGHALAEALVDTLPADAISEAVLPKNHAKPLFRPPQLRAELEIPRWAKYLVVVPTGRDGGISPASDLIRRWYFTDTKPTYRTTRNGKRTYPDWGNGRGARVLGPRSTDPIWTRLAGLGSDAGSTAARVLGILVPTEYELTGQSAPADMASWWAKQPDWARYAARDVDGSWFVFEKAPRAAATKWIADNPLRDKYQHVTYGCRPPVSVPGDWRFTLIQRAVAEAKPATTEAVDVNGWFALRDSCRDQNLRELGGLARRVHCADETSVGFLYGFSTLRILQVSRAELLQHFACGTTPDEALKKASVS